MTNVLDSSEKTSLDKSTHDQTAIQQIAVDSQRGTNLNLAGKGTVEPAALTFSSIPGYDSATATNPLASTFKALDADAAAMAKTEKTLLSEKPGSTQFINSEKLLREESKSVVTEMEAVKQAFPTNTQYNKEWTTARQDLAQMNSNLWNLENRPASSQDYLSNLKQLGENEPRFQTDLAKMMPTEPVSKQGQNLIMDVPSVQRLKDAAASGEGFSTVRLWDSGVKMDQLEKNPGTWDRLADFTSTAHSLGKSTMYTFGESGRTPHVPSDKEVDAFTQKLAKWSAQQKAEGKGGIDTYELWNEPNVKIFWNGTPDQLAHINSIMIKDIRQYDPTAKIASPAASWQSTDQAQYTDQYLTAMQKYGLNAKTFDQIDFHGYGHPGQPPEQIQNTINDMKAVLAKHGLAQTQLTDSEDSWGKASDLPNPQQQADYLARKVILEDYDKVTPGWYGYGFSPWGSLADSTGKINAAGQAEKTVTENWLNGAHLENLKEQGDIWTATLEKDGKQEMIAWTESGKSESFNPGSAYSGYETLNGKTGKVGGNVQLTGEPTLLWGF